MSDTNHFFKVSTRFPCISKFISTCFCIALLSGCVSTQGVFSASEVEHWDQLYLRGVFTWWEAEEKYRVNEVEDNLYRVSVELVADGQPYDFKFADEHWTPGLRCGYANKQQDETLHLGIKVQANCDTQVNNFKFTPDKTGKFHFYFDARKEAQPAVYIEAANPS